MRTGRFVALAVGLTALLAGALAAETPARAEDAPPADRKAARHAAAQEARKADTLEAIEGLQTALDYLVAQPRFGFIANMGYDVLQTTGQMLEFGGRRRVVVRRPDRVRVDVKSRTGEDSTLFYDGQTISIDLPDANAYASAEKSGNLDEMIDYLQDGLGEPAPLLDLVRAKLVADLESRVEYGLWVGEERLGDKLCDHLAFQNDRIDLQVWIESGERPLLVRMIITYKKEPGSPQFWADFTQWDLDPDVDDDRFVYTAPDGAERIPFAPRPDRKGKAK